MTECKGDNFILNGRLVPAGMFSNSMVYEGDSLYEVIRIVNGNPLFFHDHIERLANSARLQGKKHLADEPALKASIFRLIETENKPDINLKIVFNYRNKAENYIIYLIDSVYPTQSQYETGVKGILYYAQRKAPESKVIDQNLRIPISEKLKSEGAYEALLVNENDEITEGSRSNIFFLRNETMITAPESMVLNGITRKNILDICRENNLPVKFECVKVSEIGNYDGSFMTGTSPIILPFSSIGENTFDVHYIFTEKIRKLYLKKAEASMRLF